MVELGPFRPYVTPRRGVRRGPGVGDGVGGWVEGSRIEVRRDEVGDGSTPWHVMAIARYAGDREREGMGKWLAGGISLTNRRF